MPRKGLRPRERRGAPPPDYKYGSVLVAQLVNKINFQGRSAASRGVVYGALDAIQDKMKTEPLKVFESAIENVRPLLEVRARRVGGATYQVPVEVRQSRGISLSMRWILAAARMKTGKPMAERLAEELMAASRKEGTAFKKREDTHKMAEANRTFAHYRW